MSLNCLLRQRVVAMMFRWLLVILLAGVIVQASMKPPAALPATAGMDQFSAARAMQTLRRITRAPHPVGSIEHGRVQADLVQSMQALGLNPVIETRTGVRNLGHSVMAARVSNLIGHLKGKANTRAVVLAAHYDSVDRAPGANDDGAGVAVVLETIRALKAGPMLNNDVIVLITDGEELGLLGSSAVAVHDPWLREAGVVLNFEGRGDQGPAFLFETSGGNHSIVKEFAAVAPDVSGSSLFYTVYQHMPNDTDFTVFRKAGLPGLNFGWVGRLETYHTRLDTFENMDARAVQQAGSYALAFARKVGNSNLSDRTLTASNNEIFFDVFGTVLVHYSEALVAPLFGLLTLAIGLVLASGVRSERWTISLLLRATGASFLILLATLFTMLAISGLIDGVLSDHMLVGDMPASTWLFLGMMIGGSAMGMWLVVRFRERLGIHTLAAGGCLITWLFAAMFSFTLPGASYLFFWPALFAVATLALLLKGKRSRTRAGWL